MAVSKVSVTLIAILVIAGCGSTTTELPVRTSYAQGTSFQDWKTFRLASSESPRYPRYDEMTRRALVDQLVERGFVRIEDGRPNFRVAFELSFRGESTPQMAPEMGSTDPARRAPAGANPAGSLTIKMLDPETSEVLWEGTISEFTINAIEPQKGLEKAVWRVLVEFPPLAG